ncbi:GNAT family N-acetyltransferase [Saccharibacillus sp. O23]|uniref:GNAT family N-acetyltransferase n=1 Tax=Saccharibacillus sp. O23 TaxID=2009338 RepID=UPI000B4E4FA7|nr:GNAT family N-acetyltransferase [Saccharibacillus sp. O23]OWR31541.1 GNAT family N-acetyltransferase [Saccharibacillus sp. O23]
MLDERQLQDIKSLQRLCERQDGILLKLNDEMLRSDSRSEDMDYFRYENDRLVGFLALYRFGEKFEVCGMVHPDYRRKGIFTGLWQEASASGSLAAASSVLLNAPKASVSASEWLKTTRCRYSFSEYEMAWQADAVQEPSEDKTRSLPSVSYRPYEPGDREDIVRLCEDGFEMSEIDTEQMLEEEQRSASRSRSMLVLHGETVGTLAMDYDVPGQAWVFGFVVDADYRGNGIGRSALKQVIRRENEAGLQPHIGVETQNDNALHLYESCGFRSYAVQDYYELLL